MTEAELKEQSDIVEKGSAILRRIESLVKLITAVRINTDTRREFVNNLELYAGGSAMSSFEITQMLVDAMDERVSNLIRQLQQDLRDHWNNAAKPVMKMLEETPIQYDPPGRAASHK